MRRKPPPRSKSSPPICKAPASSPARTRRWPLWSNHPKVFIDVASTGQGKCPYCGTVYQLKAGEKVHAH
jgi:uncharacterized Zn-finger protein